MFIKAYQKLRTLRRWDSFLAWLYSITSNLCKMRIRANSARPDGEFIEDKNPEAMEILSIGGWDVQTTATVERFDLGPQPRGKAVEPTGRLPTPWGEVKQ